MVDMSLGDRDLARVMAYLTLERLIFISILLIIGFSQLQCNQKIDIYKYYMKACSFIAKP